MVTRADFASKTIASTSETEVAEFTVPDNVRRIVALWSNFLMTPTAGKSQFGTFTLTGDGVGNVSPLKFPLNTSDAYAATLTSDAPNKPTKFIPVDIPVKPGFKFSIKATLADATSTIVYVGVIYE